jgi:hypothetical protein
MARSNLPKVTQSTINDMLEASREMAHTLGILRGKFLALDGQLARKTETLRLHFEGFAVAAETGQIADPVTLATLSRVYQDTAGVVGELASAENHAAAREGLSAALGLTLLCLTLVESGADPVFASEGHR